MKRINVSEDEVAALYRAGWSICRLAAKYAVSPTGMSGCLKRAGVKFRRPNAEIRKHVEPFEADICKAYASGMSSTKLARKYKCDKATIFNVLKRHGVARRPPTYLLKGSLSYNFKGYRTANHNYVDVYAPEHPRADRRGRVPEHIVVVEEVLGRSLVPGEVVHHVDFDEQNNDPRNLWVYPNQAEHMRAHMNLVGTARRILKATGCHRAKLVDMKKLARRLVTSGSIVFKAGVYQYDS